VRSPVAPRITKRLIIIVKGIQQNSGRMIRRGSASGRVDYPMPGRRGTIPHVTQDAPQIDRLLAPFREFSAREASGGVLLMGAALIALVWANSPFAESYVSLWRTPLTIGVGDLALSKSLHLWINDGLMAIFFLVVGLEIKREVLVGELASPRRAILPMAAAVGGAVLPAILFLLIAGGDPEASRGWGVPMATDIAFALGVLALLGSRAPVGLKIFLTALAIVDDLLGRDGHRAVLLIGHLDDGPRGRHRDPRGPGGG